VFVNSILFYDYNLQNVLKKDKASHIVSTTIATHFPELAGKKIIVSFVKNKDYYMACAWRFSGYILRIDTAILEFSDLAFKGCLAHELAHLFDLSSSNIISRTPKDVES